MPKTIKEKTIGKHTYRMRTLGMLTAQDVILALARPLAAFLSGAASAPGGFNLEDEEALLLRAAQGLAPAIREMTRDELRFVTSAFAQVTELAVVDKLGTGMTRWVPLAGEYDEHFDGLADEWLQWLAWGVSLNKLFGSALERWEAFRAAQKSASRKESTGSPGASSQTPD